MKKIYHLFFIIYSLVFIVACGNKPAGTEQEVTVPEAPVFAKGADVSWVTEQEADGVKFYDKDGRETDCFALMKEIGMNAIRLRVWVNPETAAQQDSKDGGYGSAYSGKEDVVAKAVRAKEQGLNVMIDFHYSDLFADPGRQLTPAAWREKSVDELKEAVAAHTTEVLEALKEAGVAPTWVQIGNETRPGMLHPTALLWDEEGERAEGWANYAALTNAGYDAAKAVFPESIVMVHIDNAYEENDWWFDRLKENGGKFDMIGLSHYPMVTGKVTWQEANRLALEHIRAWAEKYEVPVMVVEVGVIYGDEDADQCMKEFMAEVRGIEQCKGVFYWEPQVYGGWRPQVYETVFGWGAYNQGAFTDEGRPAGYLYY
ncbi:MAG: glycosyl hydrolase 53 family protein [Bacteroidaceae bacterium]|nr:glycosyl hydrolase 53 family protein [Bacteroidaceae bacterium]